MLPEMIFNKVQEPRPAAIPLGIANRHLHLHVSFCRAHSPLDGFRSGFWRTGDLLPLLPIIAKHKPKLNVVNDIRLTGHSARLGPGGQTIQKAGGFALIARQKRWRMSLKMRLEPRRERRRSLR
jgi:hypothetical protein